MSDLWLYGFLAVIVFKNKNLNDDQIDNVTLLTMTAKGCVNGMQFCEHKTSSVPTFYFVYAFFLMALHLCIWSKAVFVVVFCADAHIQSRIRHMQPLINHLKCGQICAGGFVYRIRCSLSFCNWLLKKKQKTFFVCHEDDYYNDSYKKYYSKIIIVDD